jgi:hypothetical protein
MKNALVLLVAVSAPLSLPATNAEACGGCFAPPGAFTAVEGHRMVIALGVEQTVLWDQFRYTGEPEEFAWVLPVPATGAVVEIADDAFVDRIDEATAPIVQPPSGDPCGAAAGGCDGIGTGSGTPPIDGVVVLQRATVGPYETVTVGADDPDALYTWLGVNGYAFPDAGVPVLDHYIAGRSAFLVLRLRPGAGVSAMRPIRVRFRGFMGTFPLEMVTLGATGPVELSLWIIAEQRYAARNYPTVAIDPADLVWDWATSTANYQEVFDRTIDDSGGRAWVTEYAGLLAGTPLAQTLKKEAAGDYAAAAAGVAVPYLTRLRTRILVEHIDEDLELAPSAEAGDVPRTLIAGQQTGAECAGAATMSVAGSAGRSGPAASLLLAIAAGWLMLRRRAGSRPRP